MMIGCGRASEKEKVTNTLFYNDKVSEKSNNVCGFVDKEGVFTEKKGYEEYYVIPEYNWCKVKKNGLWGAEDLEGNELVKAEYANILYLNSDEFIVEKNDDHAEVVSIEGEEESIHLPEIVQELPLTVIESVSNPNIKEINIPKKVKIIKDGAFRNCPIKTIDLPEGLESIGNKAFKGTRINKIKLPKTVKDIKGGALNYPIMNIEVDSENEYYTVKDNVLFTKDMKKLVCYPWKEVTYNNKSKVETFSYEIPEGVEEIGNAAFACEQLSEVKFPNTLKKIGSMAFSSCSFMKTLNLPDSLETIGSGAFNGAFRHNEISIHIGAGVNYIGREAFGNNYISEFSVSEKNQYYSTKDGNLTNKKQDVLLFSKTKNGKVFVVPDGIKTIWKTAFDSLTEQYSDVDCVEKIVIPDSVECINYWVDLSCKNWTIGKNLKYWDAAYRIDDHISSYNEKYNIKISKQNPYYEIKNGKICYKKKAFKKKTVKEKAKK